VCGMLFAPRKCPLEGVVALLEGRVKALEELGGVHIAERNHLIGILASSESRIRAMLQRAEGVTARPSAGNGTAHLDNALARHKGY